MITAITLGKIKREQRINMPRTGPRTMVTIPRPEGWSNDPYHPVDAERWAKLIKRSQ